MRFTSTYYHKSMSTCEEFRNYLQEAKGVGGLHQDSEQNPIFILRIKETEILGLSQSLRETIFY